MSLVRLFGRHLSVWVGLVTFLVGSGAAIAQPVNLIARQNEPTCLANGI